MQVINAFIEPIVREAVEKLKKGIEKKKNDVVDVEDVEETLLDHLVKQTDG